jgi:HK97 family phage major capsid protein
MKMTLAQINAQIGVKSALHIAKITEAKELQEDPAKADELAVLVDEIETLGGELTALEEQKSTAPDLDALEAKSAELYKTATQVVNRHAAHIATTTEAKGAFGVQSHSPARMPSYTERDLTSFKRGTMEQRAEKAYGFAQWFLASQFSIKSASEYCKKNGIEVKGQVESVNSLGGALVPVQFDSDLIDLREEYGVFRRNAKVSNMTSDTKIVPRRAGGLTAYWTAEAQELTESTKSWNDVELVARKLTCLAKYSVELNEDALISIGNDLAGEIAYAFAIAEDAAGFNGDGTGAYGRIVGVTTKLLSTYTTAGGLGLKLASGNSWSEITLNDLIALKGLVPQYARKGDLKWYASQAFAAQMERLALAAGGVTAMEIMQGSGKPMFLGYPVEITQTLASAEANSQIPVLFGDLASAALFGDRRSTTVAVSEHAAFTSDQWVIRGTERLDINVHDAGTTTQAGPIVGLITAAS